MCFAVDGKEGAKSRPADVPIRPISDSLALVHMSSTLGQARLTALGRKDAFVIDQPLHPTHHIIDISRRGEGDGSFILIGPGKVQPVRPFSNRIGSISISGFESDVEETVEAHSLAAPILLHVWTVQNSETTS